MQYLCVPSFRNYGLSEKNILPESIARNHEALQIYNSSFSDNYLFYNKLCSMGINKEILVYLFLSGNYINFITTMNARQLLNFFKLRTCNRAQWEIRKHAIKMLKLVKKIAPNIFKKAPPCYCLNKCTEGNLSCKMQKETVEYFSNI